ncbi:MAG: 5'-methylthioadenosine/S-adenosylhomocysteine nucleosidase, partial [Alphaproteobacteria bacterium]|nr:5'-methylthioadenosine/S-adenosylhomocysteine nucleosidase [Alphaproteobacteria bacterium]
MKIAIVFAMQKELDLFAQQMTNLITCTQNHLTLYRGQYENLELCLTVSGVGKVNAALSVANLMQFFTPDLVINIGVSGGLEPWLKVGDIVVADELVYHDTWCGEPYKLGQVYHMPETYQTAYPELLPEYPHGLLVAGDWFMTEPEK